MAKNRIILSLASALPVSAFFTGDVACMAVRDGYFGVGALPFWFSWAIPNALRKKVLLVEKPWNPGSPLRWLRGRNKLQDWLFFPWWAWLWGSSYKAMLRWGAVPVVHTFLEEGIVELHSGQGKMGATLVRDAIFQRRKIAYDTRHVLEEASYGLRILDPKAAPLGDWHDWLSTALVNNVVSVFDFQPWPEDLATKDLSEPLGMLKYALQSGLFNSDIIIRVEAVLPRRIDQLLHWHESSLFCLNAVQNCLAKYC